MSAFCGEALILRPSDGQRVVLACVDDPGHDPTGGHRTGTDPVFRWRHRPDAPHGTEIWTEPWRDWAGRSVAEREAAGIPT